MDKLDYIQLLEGVVDKTGYFGLSVKTYNALIGGLDNYIIFKKLGLDFNYASDDWSGLFNKTIAPFLYTKESLTTPRATYIKNENGKLIDKQIKKIFSSKTELVSFLLETGVDVNTFKGIGKRGIKEIIFLINETNDN